MTIDEFRKMALEIPTAVERSHMNHPDFRVTGKIFASLGVQDENWGMVKLTPEKSAHPSKKPPRFSNPPAVPGVGKVAQMFIFPRRRRLLYAPRSMRRQRMSPAESRGKRPTFNVEHRIVSDSDNAF